MRTISYVKIFQRFFFVYSYACFRFENTVENHTDYYQEEWCAGNDSPLNTSLNHLLPEQKNIPMPTLYASSEGHRKQEKTSITQLMFYNMAPILASVAAGYDVRVSNVSPVHPKLQPHITLNGNKENGDRQDQYVERVDRVPSEYGTPQRTFPHNTYHGPTKHVR